MGINNKTNDILEICTHILYDEYNEENEIQFFNFLEETNIGAFDDYTLNWCLNTLNFLNTNNITDRIKFIKIENLKLKILSYFVSFNEYMKDTLSEEPVDINEILKEIEGVGAVYKRYLPSRTVRFELPKQGDFSNLKIVSTNNDGKEFTATVLIDHKGYVTKIVKEPILLDEENKTPENYEDLYTNLLTDILKYKDEDGVNEETPK